MVPSIQRHAIEQAEQIDWALDYLMRKWAAVPEFARLWATKWEDLDRLDFETEWAIPRSWLAELHQWTEQGMLTAEQCRRYESLLALIERMQPTLDRLFSEE